ncbi:MAG: hypothetical protein AAFZ15_13600 [Bacteroidota bacterium]
MTQTNDKNSAILDSVQMIIAPDFKIPYFYTAGGHFPFWRQIIEQFCSWPLSIEVCLTNRDKPASSLKKDLYTLNPT